MSRSRGDPDVGSSSRPPIRQHLSSHTSNGMRKRADQDRGPGGYIYVSDEPRHGELVADGASFTAVVPRQRRPPTTQAAFLTLSGETVDVVARISQAGPAASFKARVRFDELQPMLCSLTWTEVVEKLSSAARAE